MFQFLKGTIRHINLKHSRIFAEFQFLKGTIRQENMLNINKKISSFNSSKVRYDLWPLIVPWWPSIGFNSSKVRYDDNCGHNQHLITDYVSIPQRYDTTYPSSPNPTISDTFQFLKGTIRQDDFIGGTNPYSQFQFLKGTIRRFSRILKPSRYLKFQFLKGTIRP